MVAALGDLDLPEVERVEHPDAGLLQCAGLERRQVRAERAGHRPPGLLDRALGRVDQRVVRHRLRRRRRRQRVAQGDAAVGERQVEGPGERGLDLGDGRVVALQHQRAGRVEGEARPAPGVDAPLVLLGETGEERLGLELVRGEPPLPGQPEHLGGGERGLGLPEQLEGHLGDGRELPLLAPLLLLVPASALLPAGATHVLVARLGVALDGAERSKALLGVLVGSGHRLQRGGVLGQSPGGEGKGVGSGDGDLAVAGAPGHRRQTGEHRLFRRLPDVAEEALGDRPLGDLGRGERLASGLQDPERGLVECHVGAGR